MNKLLIFPIFIMLFISAICVFAIGEEEPTYEYTYKDPSNWYWNCTNVEDDEWQMCVNATETTEAWNATIYSLEWYSGFWNSPHYHPDMNETGIPQSTDDLLFRNGETGIYEYYNNYTHFAEFWITNPKETMSTKSWFNPTILFGLFALATGVVIATGIRVFGIGLSETSQRTIFLATIFGSLWVFMTILSYEYLIVDEIEPFGTLIYIALSIMFMLGLVFEINAGGNDE